ncbi:MAG TPA: hypothetical protein VF503_15120 [Sphingobium sp.]|uniref:hypothetical protein n=1 Tax=Sphingobium sp. TaxID=1912891 RepID=UPI002ED11301
MGVAAVLVVVDDPLLRMVAVDHIEDAGFEVWDAEDAGAAILTAHTDIHLLFTDIEMPGSMYAVRPRSLAPGAYYRNIGAGQSRSGGTLGWLAVRVEAPGVG